MVIGSIAAGAGTWWRARTRRRSSGQEHRAPVPLVAKLEDQGHRLWRGPLRYAHLAAEARLDHMHVDDARHGA